MCLHKGKCVHKKTGVCFLGAGSERSEAQHSMLRPADGVLGNIGCPMFAHDPCYRIFAWGVAIVERSLSTCCFPRLFFDHRPLAAIEGCCTFNQHVQTTGLNTTEVHLLAECCIKQFWRMRNQTPVRHYQGQVHSLAWTWVENWACSLSRMLKAP